MKNELKFDMNQTENRRSIHTIQNHKLFNVSICLTIVTFSDSFDDEKEANEENTA